MSRDLSIARRMSTVRELVGAEVLVIDQDESVQRGMVKLLSEADLNVTCVSTPEDAMARLDKRFFSVVVVDLDTPTPGAGLATISAVKDKSPTSMVVILTPRKSFDDTVAAIRAGAIDIVLKSTESVPYLKDRIKEAASRSVDTREVTGVLREAGDVYDSFLKLFMDAERRVMELEDRVAGRDPNKAAFDELRVLVVDSDPSLVDALASGAGEGYLFHKAMSGGQGLDLCGTNQYHYVMVSNNLFDLPSSMVAHNIKAQYADTVVLAYSGPGPDGKVEVVENEQSRVVIASFGEPQQLLERLGELAEAFLARSRERRFTQAFRERHYDFLRRYINLKTKIERALTGTS
ncbi:response regulator [Haliangium sp.]|uniref:response regulator n=1 Tax=Haliangium sp. TaxID=2663208 RepID=UPI003D150A88